jgi:flagellar motor switch/type III secretory pathway protein FliN
MSSSQTSSSSSEHWNGALAQMLDVGCTVEFILGTGTMTVRECLRLERQSVVKLAQVAGSDIQMRVNGIAVATGEVVILDGTALRISHITPPAGLEAV